MLDPLVKWSGSKRSQAKAIVEEMFRKRSSYETYIEPFCGGCSVLYYTPFPVARCLLPVALMTYLGSRIILPMRFGSRQSR